ncbi:MAG: TerC family protein [Phycisphaerae bacterium]
MLGPNFANDLATIATLVVLEGLLSADNALVLAILVRHLPKLQQVKALRYGIIGAFVFRAIGVVTASWLIHYWQFKAAGAAYLLYLTIKHFFFTSHHEVNKNDPTYRAGPGFWKTIVLVELTDVAFSVDSIVAAVGMTKKIWIIYLGGIMGIIAMRFVAGTFLRLLDRFPTLERAAYLLVGWIGIKLGTEAINQIVTGSHDKGPFIIPKLIFWVVMVTIFLGGMLWPGKKTGIHKHAPEIKDFEKEEDEIFPHRHG